MDGLQIGELAERSGFSPDTIRYYERIGLLEAPARSAAGYRIYGPEAGERLRFVSRAKALGLSLDEIRELVRISAAGQCELTRRHLRHLVAHKVREVGGQLAELAAFSRQLEVIYERLGQPLEADGCEPDGGCDCVPEAPDIPPSSLDDELEQMPATARACGCVRCREAKEATA